MPARRSPREIIDELKELSERRDLEPDPQRLLHEIHVYQEELQAQNDALSAAQSAIEETRDRFVELYDFAPNGYLTLDSHGLILRVNLTAAAILGKSKTAIEGMPLLGFVVAGERSGLLDFLRRCRVYAHDHGRGRGRGRGAIVA